MRRIFPPLVMGVTLFAIILGLMLTGGPGTARLEALDQNRAENLRTVKSLLECKAPRINVPPQLTEDALRAYCPSQSSRRGLVDPETSEPFRFAQLDGGTFEVCARFALNRKRIDLWGGVLQPAEASALREDGVLCLKGTLSPPT